MLTKKQAKLLVELEDHRRWQGWDYLRLHHSWLTYRWLRWTGHITHRHRPYYKTLYLCITQKGLDDLQTYCAHKGIGRNRCGLWSTRYDEVTHAMLD